MIWIIAGTSEGRELIERIKDLHSYIITLATDEGKEFISSDKLIVGRMDYEEMKSFVIKNKISLIVNMTHPYAKVVSSNAQKLAKELKIQYIRYMREKTNKTGNSIYIKSYEDAYMYISKIKGTVFFTTGSKNIEEFEKVRGNNRFIYRILPALESIKKCNDYNISIKDIIAVLGPFSKKYNKIMFNEYKADYVIMKDSGIKGGTMEKVKACEELKITPIIIGREEEEGVNSLDEVEEIIRKNS